MEAIIVLTLIGIIGMFLCILFFPTITIKGKTFDTFYIPVLLVAIILLLFPLFDKHEFINILTSNSNMNPLKILVLFISVSFISIVLDTSGFFSYIATIFINKFKASQFKLFVFLYSLISILTIFTSNDIVILTFTPFILHFARKGNINPIPYLVMEFVAANTYSMLLIIGNPTNIYLASIFNLSFIEYLKTMFIPVIIVGLSSFLILNLLFHKDLSKKIEVFDIEKSKITNKFIMITSLIHLGLVTILLAISSYVNLEMWLISFVFASSLLIILIIYSIIKKDDSFLLNPVKRIPYNLIPFVLSMFTLINALDSFDFFKNITLMLHDNSFLYLLTSTLLCNIVNNIPMTLAFGSILENTQNISLIYATIIGSNIGAILTPVGALAGIMWMRLLKVNNVNYTFKEFSKNGLIITLFLLAGSSISLLII